MNVEARRSKKIRTSQRSIAIMISPYIGTLGFESWGTVRGNQFRSSMISTSLSIVEFWPCESSIVSYSRLQTRYQVPEANVKTEAKTAICELLVL